MSRSLALLGAAVLLVASACGDGGGAAQAGCRGGEVDLIRDGTLIAGMDLDSPPFAFIDPASRKPTGFEVELLEVLAKRMSLEVSFVDQSYPGLVVGVLAGRFDVVGSGLRAGEVDRQACVTGGHLDADLGVVVNRQRTPSIEDATGLTGPVGVQRDTRAESWAREHVPGEVRAAPAPEDLFRSLREGGLQGVVHDLAAARWEAKRDRAFAVVQEVDTGGRYAFAVRPENGALRDALEDALRMVREDGAYDRVWKRWFGS